MEEILLKLANIVGILLVVLTLSAMLIWVERRLLALWQERLGPNRVGHLGLMQVVADMIKIFFKEDWIPPFADKFVFVLAPAIVMLTALLSVALIPFGPTIGVVDLNIGLLFVLGMSSLAVYSVVLASWASNNKYALLGAFRTVAMMVSYAVPMVLALLVPVLLAGSMGLEGIVQAQAGTPFLLIAPIAALIFFVGSLAEVGRAPFDLLEAESEIVAGFHIEYSGLKFGMFFLGEYAHMITASGLIAVLFLGGWHCPWIAWAQPEATSLVAVLVKISVISAKIAFMIFVMMWVRWTLPRFRFDQLMRLAWCGLIPMTLALFCVSAVLLYFGLQKSFWAPVANVVVVVISLVVAGTSRRPITGRLASMPRIVSDRAGTLA